MLSSWLRIERLVQFIAFMARWRFFFFSLLNAESNVQQKKACFRKHFEVFFSIADSYDCVKNCIQVSQILSLIRKFCSSSIHAIAYFIDFSRLYFP